MKADGQTYNLIVVGGSSGGLEAFMDILSGLDNDFRLPIVFALHQQRKTESLLPKVLKNCTKLIVKEPDDKEPVQDGYLYIAPPDYHLLVEPDGTMSYSYSEPVNFSRPSIDTLFFTAAESFGAQVAGLLLTGANNDGAKGLLAIMAKGGLAIVQSPKTATFPEMPEAAIKLGCDKNVTDLKDIAIRLNHLNRIYAQSKKTP